MPGMPEVKSSSMRMIGIDLFRHFRSVASRGSEYAQRFPFNVASRVVRTAAAWVATVRLNHEFAALSGVDASVGLCRAGGDVALYVDLLIRFRTQHVGSISQIWAAITAGNEVRARHYANALLCDAALLGMPDVYRVTHGLVATLGKPPSVSLPVLLNLEAVLMDVIHGLRDLMPLTIRVAEPVADPSDLMRELWFLLITKDCRAVGLVVVLRRKLQQLGREGEIGKIADCVERYDFAGALNLLAEAAPVSRCWGVDSEIEDVTCR